MNERDTQLPLSFRRELLVDVMGALGAGECCSLVGASGVGKSNLVRFIHRPDVQEHYWGEARTWVVAVDVNGLVFGELPDEYVVAELILHRLIREAERRGLPAELRDDFDRKYFHLVEHQSAHLAMRYLERVCGQLIERTGIRLVFAFDQFEDLWQSLAPRLFLNLRHLRDEFKYRLAFLVVSRERLARSRQRARDDLKEVESFCELFSSHTYGLGAYSPADAATMLERVAYRRGLPVGDELSCSVLGASGGHSALLRAVFWALQNGRQPPADHAALLAFDAIAEECAKIWDDLLPEEQAVARAVALGQDLRQFDRTVLAELQLKCVVVGEPPALFSPLLAAYARGRSQANLAGIVVAPRLHQVWLDGRPLDKALSPLEFSLLEFLARNAGEVCRREDILQRLYGEAAYDANDERLDTLLRRLRETLGEDAKSPRYLVTHRGVGIRLTRGRIQE